MADKEYHKQWYAANTEKRAAASKKYRETHPEKIKELKKKFYVVNRDKIRKKQKAYRDANPEKIRERGLKRLYGLTISDYNQMIINQNGTCAICLEKFSNNSRYVHVDHDHTTGRIRGILCHGCNVLLGRARDCVEILNRAAEYIQYHKTKSVI